MNDMLAVADAGEGSLLVAGCTACHNLEPNGPKKVGPSLFGIVGAPMAGQRDFAYSPPLRKLGEMGLVWTTDELYDFLRDPSAYAPGTFMNFEGMLDPQDRMDLVAYLMTLR